MNSSDQADSGGDWRVQLQDMRTISALRAGSPQADEVERLSDRALRAAALNPDHSEEARSAAAAALRARRLSPEPWRVRVPSFLSARDLERGDALFFGFGHAVRQWIIGAAILAALVAQVLFWIGKSEAAAPALGSALALFVVWYIASVLRRYPARAVLLRKFGGRGLSAPLERMLRRELRVYGHIVEVSDRLVPPTTLNQIASGHGVVLNARDYRNLALRLRDRIALSLEAMDAKPSLRVRCSEPWWRISTQLVADSSDVIVVDLSFVGEGAAWELDLIRELNVQQRCVFVALWGKLEEADAALRAAGLSQRCFPYAPDGEMQRRPQFRAAMLAAMRATHAADA